MLVVKAEIWPYGEVGERFEIARIGITNISGRSPVANYTVVGILGRDRQEWVTRGTVMDHIRLLGWQPLVARALTEQQDAYLHAEYVQTVADLLRKG